MGTIEEVEAQCWEKALEIFNTELTNDDAKKIVDRGVDNVKHPFHGLHELQCYGKECHPTFVLLGKALVAIDKHAPVIDVMIQQQPFIVNLVWGSIRFLIQASARAHGAGSEIIEGLKQIVESLPRYHLELRNYHNSTRVSNAVAAALARCVSYLVNAQAFFLKSRYRRTVRSGFSCKFKRILDELARFDTALECDVRAAQGKVQAELKEGALPAGFIPYPADQAPFADQVTILTNTTCEFEQQSSFRDAQRESIASLHQQVKEIPQMVRDSSVQIANAQMRVYNARRDLENAASWLNEDLKQTKILNNREPSTCEWVFGTPTYKAWVDSGCHNCLYIQGIAGCGKTELATYLTETADTGLSLAYYHGASQRQNFRVTAKFAVAILASLLNNNALQQHKRFPLGVQMVSRLARDFVSSLECPTDKLLDALDYFIDIVPTFTLVVDALDECDNPENRDAKDLPKLLDYLRRIASVPKARVIILSRIGVFSGEALSTRHQLVMNESFMKRDIKYYLERTIARNQGRNPGLGQLKADIIEKITKDCQGMFLWVKCAMENLLTAATENEVVSRLNEFPSEVIDYYHHRLRENGASLRNSEKTLRRCTFLLLLAAFEPLTVDDISNFLALNTSTNSFDKSEELFNPTGQIQRLCGPVITVIMGQVQFSHKSAETAVLRFDGITRKEADAFLALKLLSKLSQTQYRMWGYTARLLQENLLPGRVLKRELEQGFKKSVTYRYSCLYWQEHVTKLVSPSDELLAKLSQFLLGNEFVTWSEFLFQLKPNSGIGSQIQVKVILQEWYRGLSSEEQKKIPIEAFFVESHESLSSELKEKGEDVILPYLPIVRLGQYFNVGGKTSADFQKAYEYKMTVAVGYEEALGPRDPLTLRAKTEVFKEFFFLKRFDEAERGLKDIARIQRDVIGEDVTDYFFTLQLLGLAQICVTKFESAISTLTDASNGFCRLSGVDAFLTLQTGLFKGWALERTPQLQEAFHVYDDALKLWMRDGSAKHPFSLMLKASLGSVCRKLGRIREGEVYFLESLSARKSLYTVENVTYIDTALQLAALCYADGRYKESIEYLDFISHAHNLDSEFERQCQEQHIRALIALDRDFYTRAKVILQRLLNEVSGDGRNKNNRELLWVRITLSDALRSRGKDDEALMVFSDLVVPRVAPEHSFETEDTGSVDHEFSLSLEDEPESPAQLAIVEQALRLVKDAAPNKADQLLRESGLRWKRRKDFWVLQGGPITDTASISGLKAGPDYQFVDLPKNLDYENTLQTAEDQFSQAHRSQFPVDESERVVDSS